MCGGMICWMQQRLSLLPHWSSSFFDAIAGVLKTLGESRYLYTRWASQVPRDRPQWLHDN
jgi:hypothetical protein